MIASEWVRAPALFKVMGAYWYYADHHAGQNSPGYRSLCLLSRVYTPGALESSGRLLSDPDADEDAQESYARLCARNGEPFWDIWLTDDGTLDTVFGCCCRTCGHEWDERFGSEDRRFEDEDEDAESLREMMNEIREQMYRGSGYCQCGS